MGLVKVFIFSTTKLTTWFWSWRSSWTSGPQWVRRRPRTPPGGTGSTPHKCHPFVVVYRPWLSPSSSDLLREERVSGVVHRLLSGFTSYLGDHLVERRGCETGRDPSARPPLSIRTTYEYKGRGTSLAWTKISVDIRKGMTRWCVQPTLTVYIHTQKGRPTTLHYNRTK